MTSSCDYYCPFSIFSKAATMSIEMTTKVLKWISILPSVVIVYVVSKIISNSSFMYANPSLIHDILNLGGFGGHYILGPLYLFQREATAIGLAIFAGVYIAPTHKKVVYFSLLGLWIVSLVISAFGIGTTLETYQWTTELIIVAILETIAQVVGVIACGYVLEHEQKLHIV